jgi:uncharacterized coiled-coil protein SlyX
MNYDPKSEFIITAGEFNDMRERIEELEASVKNGKEIIEMQNATIADRNLDIDKLKRKLIGYHTLIGHHLAHHNEFDALDTKFAKLSRQIRKWHISNAEPMWWDDFCELFPEDKK